ncbi:ATP-binding cassette domain-containing protein [Microbacterium sp. CJ88]|uniref:ATP-binding cassette domain-containing protein n=1 Tax=Microbacterium sp. CJ88 TaxID=3445672 RepID=UPI003F65836C
MPDGASADTLVVSGVSKSYGSTRAVNDASFRVGRGELIGIAGHNGAGKSTILKVVNGAVAGDGGQVTVNGIARPAQETVAHPEKLGVRTVYQELSLCASLRVDETAAVFDHSARGFGWRRAAWTNLERVLDEMFPGHGIRRDAKIRDLSIARRQMIECASTMVDGAQPPALVILDEPTSSLDAAATASFYAYLKKRAADGVSAIITTHRLHEMIDNLSRIYVMRDGRVLGEQPAAEATKASLVTAMGVASHEHAAAAPARDTARVTSTDAAPPSTGDVVVRIEQGADADREVFEIRSGEIIGFAGLEGHGQLTALEALYRAARPSGHTATRRTPHQSVTVTGEGAYVSGDRGVRGIFPIWDVASNISFSSLSKVTAGGLIRPRAERALVDEWYGRLGIKGRPSDVITSLSGGTQQKALMARAMSVESSILLLEDPTRGVDQSTKSEVYAMLRGQADAGQTIVWYSTENEELRNCDRVFVFHVGRIVATIRGEEATEDAVIALSFGADDSSPAAQEERP